MIPDDIKAKIAAKFVGAEGSDRRCKGIHASIFYEVWPYSANTAQGRCQDCGLVLLHPLSDAPEPISETAQSALDIVAAMNAAPKVDGEEVSRAMTEVENVKRKRSTNGVPKQ